MAQIKIDTVTLPPASVVLRRGLAWGLSVALWAALSQVLNILPAERENGILMWLHDIQQKVKVEWFALVPFLGLLESQSCRRNSLGLLLWGSMLSLIDYYEPLYWPIWCLLRLIHTCECIVSLSKIATFKTCLTGMNAWTLERSRVLPSTAVFWYLKSITGWHFSSYIIWIMTFQQPHIWLLLELFRAMQIQMLKCKVQESMCLNFKAGLHVFSFLCLSPALKRHHYGFWFLKKAFSRRDCAITWQRPPLLTFSNCSFTYPTGQSKCSHAIVGEIMSLCWVQSHMDATDDMI